MRIVPEGNSVFIRHIDNLLIIKESKYMNIFNKNKVPFKELFLDFYCLIIYYVIIYINIIYLYTIIYNIFNIIYIIVVQLRWKSPI